MHGRYTNANGERSRRYLYGKLWQPYELRFWAVLNYLRICLQALPVNAFPTVQSSLLTGGERCPTVEISFLTGER